MIRFTLNGNDYTDSVKFTQLSTEIDELLTLLELGHTKHGTVYSFRLDLEMASRSMAADVVIRPGEYLLNGVPCESISMLAVSLIDLCAMWIMKHGADVEIVIDDVHKFQSNDLMVNSNRIGELIECLKSGSSGYGSDHDRLDRFVINVNGEFQGKGGTEQFNRIIWDMMDNGKWMPKRPPLLNAYEHLIMTAWVDRLTLWCKLSSK